MKHLALQMYDYHTWANKKVFNHLKQLPPDIYRQEIQSVFPTIAHVLAHMHVVDTVWFGTMQERGFDEVRETSNRLQEEMPAKRLEEVEAMSSSLTEQYQAFFACQHDMERVITSQHPRFAQKEFRLAELVHHVVNHGSYHRGNITAMLRQMGHKGVPTDYVFYLS